MALMIEPTPYISRDELERLIRPGESIFAITERSLFYFQCVILIEMDSSYRIFRPFLSWHEPADIKTYTSVNSSMVSSPVFMDFVMRHYPDYAEWFLFHPEWL